MDLRDLAFFEVIADLGHLGRAAERLGRTQPALTKCIDRLAEMTKIRDDFEEGQISQVHPFLPVIVR